jgi:hypothetical protein
MHMWTCVQQNTLKYSSLKMFRLFKNEQATNKTKSFVQCHILHKIYAHTTRIAFIYIMKNTYRN